jgi:glycosyltransferase involved in cell wall biosynthesis
MKGVHVVLDALRLVAQEVGSEDWRVVAYGASQYVADHGLDTTGLPIELAPAFAPHELADILSRTDVLILPSVMRETHSLLTREALIAGVPVVATDSLGPEEVVADGLNGLIVPSGSATGLADAMQRLVTDPALVARLRAGVLERPVTVRALDDQVEGLERRFVELTRREPQPNDRQPATSSIGHVTFMVGIDGAPLRYRARLPAEALGLLGVGSDVRHYRDDALPAIVETTDALVVYRVPATVQTLALIDAARERGIPVIFDVDDLIFDPEIADEIPALRLLPKDDADLWLEGVRRYRTTMEHCDGYIGSTAMLVDHARAVVGLPARRFDNGVGLLLARRSDIAIRTPRSAGPLRIGYFSGTTTHDDDWRFVEPAIADTLKKRDDVELWLGGHLNPGDDIVRLGARVRRLPFMHWTDLPAVLRDLDINLAPLEPHSRFNDAKSAIKWLEAALCSTPTIASSTEPFREAIDHEVNGVLATTLDDWRDAVDRLLDDNLLRDGIGSRARRDALLNWSPHVQARRYRAILEEARQWSDESRPERPESMAWTPVVHDEPLMPVALEPYGDALPDVAGVPEPPSRPGLVRRFVRSLGEDGVKVTARRVATRLRRWHHD